MTAAQVDDNAIGEVVVTGRLNEGDVQVEGAPRAGVALHLQRVLHSRDSGCRRARALPSANLLHTGHTATLLS